jgi:DNA excision repair protein ERCC-2
MLSMHPVVGGAGSDTSAGASAAPVPSAAPAAIGQPPCDPGASHVVAVRSMCEFTARRGDLDSRFTPAPTAQEGMAGHQLVASRRPAHYQTEISLAGEHGLLRVRGRADGYDPRLQQLEEIKTHRGDLDRMPDNHRRLHWAQAKVYAWLMCRKLSLPALNVALVYFDIVDRTETVLVQRLDAGELERFFVEQCANYLQWARQESAHREERDESLRTLAFPHAMFRQGQRSLAEAVYKTALKRECLMAQAPTGIGKTIGTLFPLLKACPTAGLDKIFYLTAKASGRRLALDALEQLCGPQAQVPEARPPRVRVLELVAREKACEHPDKACHGESCPLARGFYDRLAAARSEALNGSTCKPGNTALCMLARPSVRAVALAHDICPYYFSQDLAPWCDVVVGDYNYYFDLNAMLHGWTAANQWRVGLLVDEAHNLVERARAMYTAELDQRRLRAVKRAAPACLRPSLTALGRAWNDIHRDQLESYRAYDAPPRKLLAALQQTASAIGDHLAAQASPEAGDLLRFYFDVLHFLRLAEVFGGHSLFDISRIDVGGRRRDSVLCLRNVVPATFLRPRLAAAATTTLFSATLVPRRFHADMLGLPESTHWIDVESPYDKSQLAVHVVSDISTRFRGREASIHPIAQVLAEQYRCSPGNYLAFFSSFDYMNRVAERLAHCHPHIPARCQARGMSEAEQGAFLAGFQAGGACIGFAVLGGSFAEAIDLPGDRLRGVFVATLGLPQVNPVNEEMRKRMQASFGSGYDYAYLFPGLQKVVQAAGRVIRTPADRGVLYLIDDRFARSEVRRLLPAWWTIGSRPASSIVPRAIDPLDCDAWEGLAENPLG